MMQAVRNPDDRVDWALGAGDVAREMPALTPEMIAEYQARTIAVRRGDLRTALLALDAGRPAAARAILAEMLSMENGES